MLARIREHARMNESFAFETTLSGRGPDGGREDAATALQRSDAMRLAAASEPAALAGNQPPAKAFLDRMRPIGPPPGSVTAP